MAGGPAARRTAHPCGRWRPSATASSPPSAVRHAHRRRHLGPSVAAEVAAATALDPLHAVRGSAFPPGEFVGQQSLVSASEIRTLARAAGIRPGVSVLDLCCGAGGPGSLLVAEMGCTYLGVDADPAAVALARARERAPLRPAPASRSAGCRRCRTGGSTSCCSSRPCSRSPTSRPSSRDLVGAAGRWPVRLHRRGGCTAHRGGAGCGCRVPTPSGPSRRLSSEPTSRPSACGCAGRPTGRVPPAHGRRPGRGLRGGGRARRLSR